MPDSKNVQSSHTLEPSPDPYRIGRTGGQRSAEILAGLRANLMPSVETNALSTIMGRTVARILTTFTLDNSGTNYVFARSAAMLDLMREALPDDKIDVTLVDLASGFSANALKLAREFPDLHVIEIDQPDVMRTKQERLQSSSLLNIPPKLTFMHADLSTTPVDELLKMPVDVVGSEGLLGYLNPAQHRHVLDSVYRALKPGGVFVTDATRRAGMEKLASSPIRSFQRQSGKFEEALYFDGEEAVIAAFEAAGFVDIKPILPSTIAEKHDLPQPINDVAWVLSARRPS